MSNFSNRNQQDYSQPSMSDNSQQPPGGGQDLSKHSFSEDLRQYREQHLQETRDKQRSMQSELAPQQQQAGQSTQEQSQTQGSQVQDQSQQHQRNQEQDR